MQPTQLFRYMSNVYLLLLKKNKNVETDRLSIFGKQGHSDSKQGHGENKQGEEKKIVGQVEKREYQHNQYIYDKSKQKRMNVEWLNEYDWAQEATVCRIFPAIADTKS